MTGDLTDDLFLGGRLRLTQPRRGHRVGGDAALLAAAARSFVLETTVAADFGAGVGAVGLALARFGAAHVTLVEIDAATAALASENARRNGLEDRAETIAADVATLGRPGGPEIANRFDLVVANPPFDGADRFRASPDSGKALAHAAPGDLIEDWTRAAARVLKPGGVFVQIHRPEALGDILAALDRRFGDVRVRAVHPRAGEPASRILVSAKAGSRGRLALLPPLVMHGADGAFTPDIDAAQRGEAAIAMG